MVSAKKGISDLVIISRNHFNMLLLISLLKPKKKKKTTAAKAIWSDIRILTVFIDVLIAKMNGGSDPYQAHRFLKDCN